MLSPSGNAFQTLWLFFNNPLYFFCKGLELADETAIQLTKVGKIMISCYISRSKHCTKIIVKAMNCYQIPLGHTSGLQIKNLTNQVLF